MINPDILRSRLSYIPETGRLYWKFSLNEQKRWNTTFAGKEAFTHAQNGYRRGTICKRQYLAHRVIWAIVHGEWPKHQIDHINGDRSDNRIENLRPVTQSGNSLNMAMTSRNSSGVSGVYFHQASGKWTAGIGVNGVRRHLGLFDDFESAVAKRQAAEREHGYHENHGRRNSQQARDQRQATTRDATDDLPGVQPDTQEKARPVPERDLFVGRNCLVLSSLRDERRGVLR